MIVINIVLFRYNYVDLHYSIIGNPILYYINAICGAYSVILFSWLIENNSKVLMFYDKNSFIIFATHLNLRINSLAIFLSSKLVNVKELISIIGFIITIIVETIFILAINKYARYMVSYKEFKFLLEKTKIKY